MLAVTAAVDTKHKHHKLCRLSIIYSIFIIDNFNKKLLLIKKLSFNSFLFH